MCYTDGASDQLIMETHVFFALFHAPSLPLLVAGPTCMRTPQGGLSFALKKRE